jgi:hypothetical protein
MEETTMPETEEPMVDETQEDSGVMKGIDGGKLEPQDEAYILGLMKLLHSKETSPMVDDMLKNGGDPKVTIPKVAMLVNQKMADATGKVPSLRTALAAFMYLVGDLIELGNKAGFFNIETEEDISVILKATLQAYIEKGLKDGTIDPVELQKEIEPLLSEEQRTMGSEAANGSGLPMDANHDTAMASYGMQKKREGVMQGGQR